MVVDVNSVEYQKLKKSGSVLKGLRSAAGGGKGCIAGGITFLVSAALIGIALPPLGLFFAVPGLILILVGTILRNRGNASYLKYYMEETGLSEAELARVDSELNAPNVHIIGYRQTGGSSSHPRIACIITENYFVTETYYIRRLDDMLAAGFTRSMTALNGGPLFGLLCLSKQDENTYAATFAADSDKKESLCVEIVNELFRRNPAMVRGEWVVCGEKKYHLLRSGKEVVKLYREGNLLGEIS